jgi:hypothetical protein
MIRMLLRLSIRKPIPLLRDLERLRIPLNTFIRLASEPLNTTGLGLNLLENGK